MKRSVRRWLVYAQRLRCSGFRDDNAEAVIALADEVLELRSKIQSLREDRTAWRRIAIGGVIREILATAHKSPHHNHDADPGKTEPHQPSSPGITSYQGGHPDVKKL